MCAAAAAAPPHGAPFALPVEPARHGVTARGSRHRRRFGRAGKSRGASAAELDHQARPARQGVYTHKRPLCVDGGLSLCLLSLCLPINRAYERPPETRVAVGFKRTPSPAPRTRRFASDRGPRDDVAFNNRKRNGTHSNNLADAMFRTTAPPSTSDDLVDDWCAD